MKIFLLLLSFAILAMAMAQTEQVVSLDGVFAKILGSSGKLSIGLANDTANAVKIEFKSLIEVDKDGKKTNNQNSLSSLASTNAKFSALEDFEMPGVAANLTVNLTGKTFTYTATDLPGGATLKVQAFIFTTAGTIKNGAEDLVISKGNVKFNIGLEKWAFANAANMVEFTFNIKGKSDEATKTSGKNATYSLGNADITLSEKVKVDGTIKDMPAGSPSVTGKGNKQVFTFRFPNGQSILYDPVVELDGAGGASSGSLATATLAFIFALACLSA